jgi:hypothetical protein
MKKKYPATRNLVAKHTRTFNRSKVFLDRKKESKKQGATAPKETIE